MRIDRLELHNFRVIERFVASFDPNFNVIIGENGRGKTTILEVLKRVLSGWAAQAEGLLASADTRSTVRDVDGAPYKELHEPASAGIWMRGLDGRPVVAMAGSAMPIKSSFESMVGPLVDSHWSAANTDPAVSLPLLARFSPWREPPHRRKATIHGMEPKTRFFGYNDAFDLHADMKGLANWLRTWDEASIQERREFAHVEEARRAIVSCLPDCVDIRYMPRFRDVIVRRESGGMEPLWRLSDGYRTMAALVGEMAWRAAILNPGLAGAPANVEGVVLIDEIDLHLHPRWQRHVVADLQRAFPKVQFFATTHSPFIIQSMKSEQVFNLDREVSMPYQRSSVEDIAEEAMGVDHVQRSQRFHEMMEAASAFFAMLRAVERGEAERADLRRRYQELITIYADEPAYAALLRAEVAAAMGGA